MLTTVQGEGADPCPLLMTNSGPVRAHREDEVLLAAVMWLAAEPYGVMSPDDDLVWSDQWSQSLDWEEKHIVALLSILSTSVFMVHYIDACISLVKFY